MPHTGELDIRLAVLGATNPTVGVSPWTYTADKRGMLTVTGGTVSVVTYARGSDIAAMPLTGGWVMMAGDTVNVTYVVAPNVKFFPWG